MEEDIKTNLNEFSSILEKATWDFIMKHKKDDLEGNHIVSFILSGHLSSLVNCFKKIWTVHPEVEKSLKRLVGGITDAISSDEHCTSVQISRSKKPTEEKT